MRRTAMYLPVAAVVLSTVGAVALTGDLGAPGTEDAAARSVVEGIYDAGFANLKTMAAAQ